MTRGSILRHLEKYDAALRAFDRAIALAPKNGRAYGLAGAVCLRKNEPQKAVGYLRKAVELEPDEKNHWLNLGVAYRKTGKTEAAIGTYRKALGQFPGDAMLLNNLGVALRKARKYDEAIRAHERAVDAAPSDAAYTRNLAIAYRGAKRYQRAIPIYIKALELGDGGPPDLLFDLATCYDEVGDTDAAIATFKRYIEAVEKSDPAAAERAQRAVTNLEKK